MPIKKNGPGCCGCSTSCSTAIAVHFLDLAGGTTAFCPRPTDITWSIIGTSSAGTAINLTGKSTTGSDFSLTFNSGQLPEGSYTLHVFEQGSVCSQPYGPTGRFDGSTSFVVRCPATSVTLTLRAQFDLATLASTFTIKSCNPSYPGTPGILAVTPTVTGSATVCSQTTQASGNVGLTLKVTGYPITVRFDAGGSNLLPADETRTLASCGSSTSDWAAAPYTWFDQYAIRATGCSSCNPTGQATTLLGLPGATVALSGGLTGTGVTGSDGNGFATLTSFVQPKVGVPTSSLVVNWAVTSNRFQDAVYNSTDYQASLAQGGNPGQLGSYGGTLCPAGGRSGPLKAGYACGGCATPVSTTLHASTLGEAYTLSYSQAIGGWTGRFKHAMPSRACTAFGAPPVVSTGPVSFYVGFTCLTLGGGFVGPNRTIWYYGDANGNPSQCDPGNSVPGSSPNWYAINPDPAYSQVTGTATCSPFMGELDIRWSVGVTRTDGTGITDFYSYDVDFTVSE